MQTGVFNIAKSKLSHGVYVNRISSEMLPKLQFGARSYAHDGHVHLTIHTDRN